MITEAYLKKKKDHLEDIISDSPLHRKMKKLSKELREKNLKGYYLNVKHDSTKEIKFNRSYYSSSSPTTESEEWTCVNILIKYLKNVNFMETNYLS